MRNRAIIPLVVGLAVGGFALKMSFDFVKRARAASSSEDLVRVVVAQQTIPMGAEIKEGMLSVSKSSRSLAPQGIAAEPKKLVARVTRAQITKGVPVLEEMLAPPGTPPGMASLVPSGYRAVAVKVDEFSSVGGFLKPGCRVDVAAILSVRRPGGTPETVSKVVLQDVLVGAVGQSLTGEGDAGANISRSVTLIVKPEEVPVLHLAATQGKIRLAMRNFGDEGAAGMAMATEEQLGHDTPDKPEPAKGTPGLLSGLAGLLLKGGNVPGASARPAWANRSSDPQTVVVGSPFVMTVLQGDKVEQVAFADPASMQRLDGGGRTAAPSAARPQAVPPSGADGSAAAVEDELEPAAAPIE